MKTIGQIFEETKAPHIIIAVDETQFWSDDVKNRITLGLGIYLVKNEPTNLCEARDSYPTTNLYNSLSIKEGFEEDQDLLSAEEDPMNLRDDYAYLGEHLIPYSYHIGGFEGTDEEVEEHYRSNRVL